VFGTLPILMKSNLTRKLMAFVLPLTIASVIFTSLALTLTGFRHFRQNISESYRHIVATAAGQIGMFIRNASDDLETMALMLASLNLNAWQQEMAFAAFMHLRPDFTSLKTAGSEGDPAAQPETAENRAPGLASVLEKARSGRLAVSEVSFDDRHLPFIYLAAPVQRRGQISEILFGRLSLKGIWNILINIQISHTGRLMILDSDGFAVSHTRITEVASRQRITNPDNLKHLTAPGQIIEWTETRDNQSILCMGMRIGDPDWVIVLSQHLSETYAHVNRHISWTLFLTLIMSLIAGILSWKIGRRFLNPIHALHRQVKNIGCGDLQSKTSVTTDDEIADLGRAFNEMVDSLQKHIVHEVEQARQLVHARNLVELGTTASKVAHEVGNLLNNIGLAVMALHSETMSPKGRKALELLKNDANRMQQFIKDFLGFAQTPELCIRPMSLHPLILEAMDTFEFQAQPANIRFELDWPQNIPPVPVDPRQMYQVFSNLIKNSLQVMQKTGGVIRVSGALEQKFLQIGFQDTGPGIDSEHIDRIFQPFFTTKKKEGSGLGLTIVKSAVEAHKGSISCQSRPGEGARFILRLPLC